MTPLKKIEPELEALFRTLYERTEVTSMAKIQDLTLLARDGQAYFDAYAHRVASEALENGDTLHSISHGSMCCVEDIEKFIAFVVSLGGMTILVDQYEIKSVSRILIFENENTCLRLDMLALRDKKGPSVRVSFDGFSIDKEELDTVAAYMDENFSSVEAIDPGTVSIIGQDRGGFYLSHLGSFEIPLDEDNYSQDTIEKFRKVGDQLTSPNPIGRIAIFEGEPGTGKTYLVKNLICEYGHKAQFIVVPSKLFMSLSDPAMVSFLIAQKRRELPFVFILEDADALLATRMADNINMISEALNMGDGLIGSALDIFLVATTNQKVKDVDPALKRPGRLIDILRVGSHERGKAEEWFKKKGHDYTPTKKTVVLAEMYQKLRELNEL